ncbi:hypothetical protein GA0074692_5881 [Micromonospora pallida]|uniref:Lipoprotein LprG n=1 Tax=Micromonospora pallida TaxID=145854 RepID=A0A1C6TFN0_9ACTN|nr:hypothetical protein [Micromonospora pallida]SCL40600.1 hypothetical protein GA0074692_5881 [Micromonospora pallida]
MTRNTGSAGTTRRLAGTAAALLATASLVAGCGPEIGPAAAPSSPAPTPKEALLASVPDGTEGTFRLTGRDSTSNVSGLVDPTAKGIQLDTSMKDPELGFTMTMSFLVLDEELWMKVAFSGTKGLTGLPKLPKRWMKLDPAKLDDPASVPQYDGADVGNAGPLIQAATDVREEGTGRYAGTVDLTAGEAAKVLEAEEMAGLGDAAKQIPFTAVVDADGNLTSLSLAMPKSGSGKPWTYEIGYTDYGAAPAIAEPSGSAAQDAPSVAYELLNG